MQWTASGEVVLMTILGGVGTLTGPLIGAAVIKYFENVFSSFNEQTLQQAFSFLPEPLATATARILGLFVGSGWELTLGVVFMLVVIFQPQGIVHGAGRIGRAVRPSSAGPNGPVERQPAE